MKLFKIIIHLVALDQNISPKATKITANSDILTPVNEIYFYKNNRMFCFFCAAFLPS